MSIDNVIKNKFCVGCGGCKIYAPDEVNISFTEDGFYEASKLKNSESRVTEVCPFSDSSQDETLLASEIYSDNNYKHDDRIGYYNQVLAGSVKDETEKINSSSGGLTTWILEKLLKNNDIDSIAHVGFDEGTYSYKISKSIEDLRNVNNKKSRYYPVTMASIQEYLNTTSDRVAIVGIPCFIKSIRLIQRKGELKNIKFCISILCGHMKSSGFGESLAWQIGVPPNKQAKYDFRVKKKGYKASHYFFEVIDDRNNSKQALNSALLGSNWGLGFFRHKSCGYCDDIAGETADVTFGDAWIDQYTNDYLGNNIVVVRNKKIEHYFKKYNSELNIDEVDVETFYQTQKGNYGNRRGGILANIEKCESWHPIKRTNICKDYAGDSNKNNIYRYRMKLSSRSIVYFKYAKRFNLYCIFQVLIFPWLIRYYLMNNGFKYTLKKFMPDKFKKIINEIKK
ncbi:coenzyme F420 hydrogenase [Vibrio cincinnatiensis]|uniref:Coenzyme F420 hydrogenase/dehydrogenase, beta subunit C-terminal domain n=1 Tax=Vibrio cincinnatiensis TaxID=675 RepID=UPI001EDECC5C|nr:Coenzyme F420 hydrogenase/dehydrogenase, beta subunit C-terminal domain [Vibrio cincinnatiensis]MCG3760322.1 coenzyme F420 hydrogenase [Vibrio cincinnatiensis]MCG3763051.1 coenzyme F420 hydrogenase [Vibrio cincinnatiensis]